MNRLCGAGIALPPLNEIPEFSTPTQLGYWTYIGAAERYIEERYPKAKGSGKVLLQICGGRPPQEDGWSDEGEWQVVAQDWI